MRPISLYVVVSSMGDQTRIRIDKFLWAVRLYKTRSLAAQACQGGRVKLNGQSVKPSHAVKPGDLLSSSRKGWVKTIKVRALLDKRVGAPRVAEFVEDKTSPQEYEKAREFRETSELAAIHQEHLKEARKGKPSKRDRRQMEEWFQMHQRDHGDLGWQN